MSKKRIALISALVLVAGVAVVATVGSLRSTKVAEVTRHTTATRQQIWQLWADVPKRTRWDSGLEYAKIDGPFEAGATGEVKLKGESATRFEVIECTPLESYTDRFFLPLGGTMDWRHSIKEVPGGLEVTFRIEVRGLSSLPVSLIASSILEGELPGTVDSLVAVAEKQS